MGVNPDAEFLLNKISKMNNNQNQPRRFDVVLGGKNPAPVTGAVLGGIEGVKRRFTYPESLWKWFW